MDFADTRARSKPSNHREGKPDCLRFTCMLVCAFLCAPLHTRPRVQRAPGIPCTLSSRVTFQHSDASRREIANSYSVVIVRESGRSSIPEASVIELKGCGVLDTRLRGYDIGDGYLRTSSCARVVLSVTAASRRRHPIGSLRRSKPWAYSQPVSLVDRPRPIRFRAFRDHCGPDHPLERGVCIAASSIAARYSTGVIP